MTKVQIYSRPNNLFTIILLLLALCLSLIFGVPPAYARGAQAPLFGKPVGPPTTVTASDGTYADKVNVTWSSVTGVSTYEVSRADDAGGSVNVVIFGEVAGTSYDDTTGTAGQVYYYFIQSCDPNCRGSSTSDDGYRSISAPTGLSATDGTYTDKVTVSWADSGATTYKVYRHTSYDSASASLLDGSVATTSYNDTTAVAGTTYYYWVKGCGGTCSGFSAEDTGWKNFSTPTGVNASDGTFTTKVSFSWGVVSGATYYEVYSNTVDNSGSAAILDGNVGTTSYDDASATPGVQYYYWVKGCGAAGCSGFSNSNGGYRQMAAASNVSATDGSHSDKVALTWDADASATSYEVFRSTVDDSATAGAAIGTPASNSFDDTTATPGFQYYYWVKSCTTVTCGGFSTSDGAYRQMASASNVAAADGSFTAKMALTWDADANATSYEVYRSTTDDSGTAGAALASPASNSYNDTTATPGTQYYYWVKSCTTVTCGGFSSSDGGYRQMAVASNVAATDGSFGDKIALTWDTDANATSYEVYRSTTNDSGTAGSAIGTPAANSYDDTSATPGTQYYYWVKSCTTVTCGAFSGSDGGYRAMGTASNVAASDGDFTSKVAVSWDAASGATYYEVYSNTEDNSGTASLLDGSVSDTSYEDTSATPSETTYYWIKACSTLECGGFSASDLGYRSIGGVTGVSATDNTYNNKIVVTWDLVPGATSYEVYRSTTLGGAKTLIGFPTDATFSDSEIVQSVTYYYWVKSCVGEACGDFDGYDTGACLSTEIFSDSFETGNFNSWIKKGKVSVDTTAALKGKYGLKVKIKGRKPAFIKNTSPNNETRYIARFYLDINNLKMKNRNLFKVFQATTGGKKKPVILLVRKVKKKYFIKAVLHQDGKKKAKTKWYQIPNDAAVIEFDWKAATGNSKNGSFGLYVDGKLQQTVTNMDTDTLKVNDVAFGVVGKIKAKFTIKGSFYLDHFDSDKVFLIGP